MAFADGEVRPVGDVRVPVEDRGLQFGESVYEVVEGWNGRAFRLEAHLRRLRESAEGIRIPAGGLQPLVEAAVEGLVGETGGKPFLLYLQVTGGAAPREHLPAGRPAPAVYGTVRPHDPVAFRKSRGRPFALVALPDPRWSMARFKTTQLLGNVLLRRHAADLGADEVLFKDAEGFLLEGATCNFFLVKDGRAYTPPLKRNILPGITRAVLLEQLPGAIEERDLLPVDLAGAEEAFITSTTRPVMPVTRIQDVTIGAGRAGPFALRCGALLDSLMDRELGPVPG